MSKFTIEVDEELERVLVKNAAIGGVSVEKFIELLLNRFAVDRHSMKVEDMKAGYEDCAELNLEWANLK